MSVETGKRYYLAHALTTYGSEHDNRIEESQRAEEIESLVPGVELVRPLKLIPVQPDAAYAMTQCYKLLKGCTGVIFCDMWYKSKGCLEELEYAKRDGKEIYVFPDLTKDWAKEDNLDVKQVYQSFDDYADTGTLYGDGSVAFKVKCPRAIKLEDEPQVQTDTANDGTVILHQDYYSYGGIETGDFIDAKDLNFNLGNVIKYVTRAGRKQGADKADDLRKAINYAQRELTRVVS